MWLNALRFHLADSSDGNTSARPLPTLCFAVAGSDTHQYLGPHTTHARGWGEWARCKGHQSIWQFIKVVTLTTLIPLNKKVVCKMETGMATHPSILAWRIPRTEEPGGLQSTGSQRTGHDWVTFTTQQQNKHSSWRRAGGPGVDRRGFRKARPPRCATGRQGLWAEGQQRARWCLSCLPLAPQGWPGCAHSAQLCLRWARVTPAPDLLLRPPAHPAGRMPGTDSLLPPTLPRPGMAPQERSPLWLRAACLSPPPGMAAPSPLQPCWSSWANSGLPATRTSPRCTCSDSFWRRLEAGARRQAARRPRVPRQPWARGPRACREACHHLRRPHWVGHKPRFWTPWMPWDVQLYADSTQSGS